jgi:hypothetical protein
VVCGRLAAAGERRAVHKQREEGALGAPPLLPATVFLYSHRMSLGPWPYFVPYFCCKQTTMNIYGFTNSFVGCRTRFAANAGGGGSSLDGLLNAVRLRAA